jgi:hypothetical protein
VLQHHHPILFPRKQKKKRKNYIRMKHDKLASYTISTHNSIAHHYLPPEQRVSEIAAGTTLLAIASMPSHRSHPKGDKIGNRTHIRQAANERRNDKKRKRMG